MDTYFEPFSKAAMFFLSSFAAKGIAAKAARTKSMLSSPVRSALAEMCLVFRLQVSYELRLQGIVGGRFSGDGFCFTRSS